MRHPGQLARAILIALLTLAALSRASEAQAQRTAATGVGRRTATVGALLAYPVFFHNQPVRVRGDFTGALEQIPWHLTEEAHDLLVMPATSARGAAPPSAAGGKPTTVDIVGTLLDVGRLQPNDPRATPEIVQLSEQRLRKSWPGVGELIILLADSIEPAAPQPAPSVRALALEPTRYGGQIVTVTGRFRGRNLFGDLPDAPGISRWDFVIQSADAAVWVTGLRPRVEGRELNIERRIDTGRWLEVTGRVREDRGLVRLEAISLRNAQPPPASEQTTVEVPDLGPPPEVVFSAPTQDETGVPPASSVRIQFSRDLDPATIRGHIVVGYMGGSSSGTAAPVTGAAPAAGSAPPVSVPAQGGSSPASPAAGAGTGAGAGAAPTAGAGGLPALTISYDQGRRVMELKFSTPLEPFRTVIVELKDGIKGTDGQALLPWRLTFSVGS